MRAGRLVALLMGIQFIPWPRLTLHFMLNKRPGYAVPSSILAPTINYTHEASGYHRSFIEERTIRCDLKGGGREQ